MLTQIHPGATQTEGQESQPDSRGKENILMAAKRARNKQLPQAPCRTSVPQFPRLQNKKKGQGKHSLPFLQFGQFCGKLENGQGLWSSPRSSALQTWLLC